VKHKMRATSILLIKYDPHSKLMKLKKNMLSSLSYLAGLKYQLIIEESL